MQTLPTLPTLLSSLEHASWHHLFAVARAHGVRCSNRWSKAALVEALYAHLSQAHLLAAIIPQLPAPIQDALFALIGAGGSLPYVAFTQHFGELRLYRPWRKEEQGEEPWLNPASPLEHLWFLGLIYAHPPKLKAGLGQRLYIPVELLTPIQSQLQSKEMSTLLHPLPRPGEPADLLWHLAIFLANVAATPISLLHGRWLPPNVLGTLATRIGLDRMDDFRLSRSERQMPYLGFLHFLAEAAELVVHGADLRLTPLGWQWLQLSTDQRWQLLWQRFCSVATDTAAPYRFSWLTPTVQGWKLLLPQLTMLSTHHYQPLADFVTSLQVQDRLGHLADDEQGERLTAFLAQPLHWLGLVDLAQAPPISANEAPSSLTLSPAVVPSPLQDTADGDWLDLFATGADDRAEEAIDPISAQPALALRLTPVGAWLLGLDGWGKPSFPSPKLAKIGRGAPDTLIFAPEVSPHHLARVAAYTTWEAPHFPALAQRLTLDAARVGHTIAGGLSLAQIFQDLTEALGRPPSRRQQQALRAWAKTAQQIRIRSLTVLETETAALMGKLRSRRHARHLLGPPLSPTRTEVNAQDVTALVQHLASLGLYAALPASQEQGRAEKSPALTPDSGILLTALLVFNHLGAHIKLPMRLPTTLLDELRSTLSQEQSSAAEFHAQAVLDEIEALTSGYLRLPAWRIENRGKDVWPRLQKALDAGEEITILYWNAEKTTPTERRITPYYVETRHDVRYLHAYCHLRQQERIFRVDRIERIGDQSVSTPDS